MKMGITTIATFFSGLVTMTLGIVIMTGGQLTITGYKQWVLAIGMIFFGIICLRGLFKRWLTKRTHTNDKPQC